MRVSERKGSSRKLFFAQDLIPQFIRPCTATSFHEVGVCLLDCLPSYLRISTVYNKVFFPGSIRGWGQHPNKHYDYTQVTVMLLYLTLMFTVSCAAHLTSARW